MKKLSNLAGLEGLFELDRRGVDIRPTLLRVITDQYLQSATHTPDEERQFTELALRLLSETDMFTRAVVAARLAHHAAAPRAIILQLARDVIDVAEPILRHSAVLTSSDLAEISAQAGAAYAAIIAKRVTPTTCETQPVEPPAITQPIAASDAAPAETTAHELCEIFYNADAQERRLIMINLEYAGSVAEKLPTAMQRFEIWRRLEAAALQHNSELVVRELERALGITRKQARRIIEDESGEPIVVAARAMQLPPAALQRILLFMNPHIGQSVGRVYELSALYNEMTLDAALRLVAIWRDADPASDASRKAETARASASDHEGRPVSDPARRAVSPSEPVVTRATPTRASGSETR